MSSRGRLYCRDSLVRKIQKVVVQEFDFNLVTTTHRPCAKCQPVMCIHYLEKGVENFEDLFLHKHRVNGVVGEELDKAVFQHGHEDVHGSHQRLTFFWFLISVGHTAHVVSNTTWMQCRMTQLSNKSDLLIVFDQLVEAEQDAEAYCPVVRLQIEANLVHNGRPLPRVVMLDHMVDAGCQLYSDEVKSAGEEE